MRILMVNKFLYRFGGCENYMLDLGEALKKAGHEVQYFGTFSEKNIVGNQYNLSIKSYDDKRIFNPFSLIYNSYAKSKLNKLIKLFKPDIVHMNNIYYHLTTSVIDACKQNNVPVVMTIHDFMPVCPNHMLYRFDTKCICKDCMTTGSFKNCVNHKCIKGSWLKSYIGYKESCYTHKAQKYDYISKMICPSNFMKDLLLEGGYKKEKVMFLRNYSSFSSEGTNVSKDDYCIYFGRISEEKGINLLLNSMPEKCNLVVAGTGPLDCQFKSLNKSNIRYVGFKTGQDLKDLIAGAKFSIYPSKWFENCPLSVAESITLGTPALVTREGGLLELVDDGVNGIFFKNNDANDLKSKIEELYFNEPLLRDMHKNCLNYKKIPNLNDYIRDLIKIYEESINEKVSK